MPNRARIAATLITRSTLPHTGLAQRLLMDVQHLVDAQRSVDRRAVRVGQSLSNEIGAERGQAIECALEMAQAVEDPDVYDELVVAAEQACEQTGCSIGLFDGRSSQRQAQLFAIGVLGNFNGRKAGPAPPPT